MASDRVLRAVLRFNLDKKSLQQVEKGTLKVEDALAEAEKKARNFEKALKLVYQHTDDLHEFNRALEKQNIELTVAQRKSLAMARGLVQVEKKMRRIEDATTHFRTAVDGFDGGGEIILGMGLAISGPLLLSMHNYINAAGESEEIAKRWLEQTQRIGKSSQDVGRVVTSQVLPVIGKVADLSEKAARFAEQNPGLIKGALTIGGALTAIGTLSVGLSFLGRWTADVVESVAVIQRLIAGQGIASTQLVAANTMLAASNNQLRAAGIQAGASGMGGAGGFARGALAAGTAVTGGVAVGVGVNEALAGNYVRGIPGRVLGLGGQGLLNGLAPGLGSGVGMLREKFGVGDEVGFTSLGRAADILKFKLGVLTSEMEDLGQATTILGNLDEGMVRQFAQMQMDIERAERQAGEDRVRVVQEFGERRVALEKDFESQRERITNAAIERIRQIDEQIVDAIAQSLKTQARADEQYYRERSRTAAQFDLDEQRNEEDHQRRLRDIRNNADKAILDAARNRDALALVRAQQAKKDELAKAEEERSVEAARRSEDLALQLAQQAQDRAIERQHQQETLNERIAALNEQKNAIILNRQEELIALQENFEQRKELLAEQQKEELKLVEQRMQEQKALLEQGFADQLRLQTAINETSGVMAEFWQQQVLELQKFLSEMSRIPSALPGVSGGRSTSGGGANGIRQRRPGIGGIRRLATGGYALTPGLAFVGEQGREYMLNNSLTRAAESAIGGRLDNATMSALISGRSGGARQVTANINVNVTGQGLDAGERASLMLSFRAAAADVMMQALG